jgi:hypothetical protein
MKQKKVFFLLSVSWVLLSFTNSSWGCSDRVPMLNLKELEGQASAKVYISQDKKFSITYKCITENVTWNEMAQSLNRFKVTEKKGHMIEFELFNDSANNIKGLALLSKGTREGDYALYQVFGKHEDFQSNWSALKSQIK